MIETRMASQIVKSTHAQTHTHTHSHTHTHTHTQCNNISHTSSPLHTHPHPPTHKVRQRRMKPEAGWVVIQEVAGEV